ncbi:hypothetical protein J4410_06860 [Candidatus Woesearchaeota archaeon]|nr:hypothetical protein [Candidatus Woesearchaeota archaeon]
MELTPWENALSEVYAVRGKDPDFIVHPRLRHTLDEFLPDHPELEWPLFLQYEYWASDILRETHSSVVQEKRKRHPFGYIDGALGLFNTRILIRQALEGHSLIQEGAATFDQEFFLKHKIFYPALHLFPSLADAIKDASREDYPDLQLYHFGNHEGTWHREDARQLAHAAMEELFIRKLAWGYREIPKRVSQKSFLVPLDYGSSIDGMLDFYQGSKTNAVIDFLMHNRFASVCQYFRHLQPYHFSKSPPGTWTNKKGRKNYPRARKAMHELFVETLHWLPEKVASSATVHTFRETPIRYGATLGGMLRVVYEDRTREAVRDYLRYVA